MNGHELSDTDVAMLNLLSAVFATMIAEKSDRRPGMDHLLGQAARELRKQGRLKAATLVEEVRKRSTQLPREQPGIALPR